MRFSFVSIFQAFSVFFMFPLGISIGIWSVVLVRRAHQSKNWPSVPGNILKSKINYYRSNGHTWDWNVTYRYHVNGIRYVSDTVFFGTTLPLDEAISITVRYKTGMEVSVYYHPDKHGVSVLVPGITPYTYSLLFIGPLFLWAGASVFGFFVL